MLLSEYGYAWLILRDDQQEGPRQGEFGAGVVKGWEGSRSVLILVKKRIDVLGGEEEVVNSRLPNVGRMTRGRAVERTWRG